LNPSRDINTNISEILLKSITFNTGYIKYNMMKYERFKYSLAFIQAEIHSYNTTYPKDIQKSIF
jgi:hypothetical protein